MWAAVREAVGAGEAAARDDAVREASTGDRLSGGAAGGVGGRRAVAWRKKCGEKHKTQTALSSELYQRTIDVLVHRP